jgi:serine/threonine protein kinase
MVKNKILHRALKSENILMKYENKEKSKYIVKLKLTDDTGVLGSSLPKNIDRNLKVYAPEVLKGEKYTEKSDLWSLGVLIYFLYFNKFPFEGKTKEEILNKIQKGINGELTKNKDFDDLLKKLLNENDEERITWSDYFKHRFFRINQDYTKFYEIEKGKEEKPVELGRDGYGIVYKAKDQTGKPKAIKIMDKERIKNDLLNDQDEIIPISEEDLKPYIDGFLNEVNHMKILQGVNNQNRNTVIFNEYFNTNENFVIVMELCDDNLFNYISNKNYLNFIEIQDILIQLNNSFKIMFNNKIFHRAIKPGNVLYKKGDDSKLIFKLKLTDACCLSKESSKIDINEIPFKQNLIVYAPEILNGEKYTEVSDLWSLGILIYFMKLKRYPFSGKNKKEVLDNITKAMKREETKNISENSDFNDLVNRLLVVDPKKRMSWKEYFRHPFLNKKISG